MFPGIHGPGTSIITFLSHPRKTPEPTVG
jgi:hypothetical protein